jgi:hypothetical protein
MGEGIGWPDPPARPLRRGPRLELHPPSSVMAESSTSAALRARRQAPTSPSSNSTAPTVMCTGGVKSSAAQPFRSATVQRAGSLPSHAATQIHSAPRAPRTRQARRRLDERPHLAPIIAR